MAAQVALALGDVAAAEPHLLRTAAPGLVHPPSPAGSRLDAVALRAEAAGRRRAAFAACERGLQILVTIPAARWEWSRWAAATAYGGALAEMAVREAMAADDPRMLLGGPERWRATTSTIRPVHPPDDDGGCATSRRGGR